jgi:transposase
MAALEGHQADDPPLRAAREEAPQAGTSGGSRSVLYAERWKVGRTFPWLGNFRRLLVRHERYLSALRAFFLVAFILMSLRRLFE